MPFIVSRDMGPKPWGTETLLCETPLYTLKRLVYEAGHQGAFQYHVRKDEAFHLAEGEAVVLWASMLPNLAPDRVEVKIMAPGETFHVPPGTPHQFLAITRCVVYEASNPVFDDRVAVDSPTGEAR